MSVFCGTWNLHGQDGADDLSDFIPRYKYDLYAIGTEECGKSIAQSVAMPSKAKWVKKLTAHMGPEYTNVGEETLAATHLVLFARTAKMNLVSGVAVAKVATGFGDVIGNKGGVGVCCDVGKTSFLFINAHFQAHQENVEGRNADFQKINTKLALRPIDGNPNVCDRFQRVFFMGDLNYRVNGNRKMVDALLTQGMSEVMLANDQLMQQMRDKEVFQGFCEGAVIFPPTYKFDKNCDVYDTSAKARVPSWTDRILWKDHDRVVLLKYDACETIKISDHRAVFAVFEVAYDPKHDGEKPTEKKSKLCSIM